MGEETKRYSNNPYNFVPLANKVFARYDSPCDLPRHGTIEPEHLSGSITCTLTAETPLCVSDGKKDEKGNEGFFKGADGRYVLPGSSLKGLIRTNMQILGFGAVRPGEDFDDVRMMYRDVASGANSISKELKDYYHNVMGVKPYRVENPNGGKPITYSVAERVHSGYLVRRSSDNACVIYPTATPYLKISRSDPLVRRWQECYTETIPVWYQAKGTGKVTALQKAVSGQQPPFGFQAGVLVCSGQSVGKPNHLYLFPAFQETEHPKLLSSQDRLTYEMDFKSKENSLKGTKSDSKMKPEFWRLPSLQDKEEQTEPWPMFHLNDDGDHLFFGRTPFFRIGYKHSLGEGVNDWHSGAAQQLVLDYPYTMLGFTYTDRTDKKQSKSYRSRVSFEDFVPDRDPQKGHMRVILMEPKPTSFGDYTKDGKNYNEEFQLRGIKQYWRKQAETPSVDESKSKGITGLTLMPAGTKFTGKIHFHNLTEDELGLLLWCLKLEDGCCQTIGKGKPYGYGSTSVVIDRVKQTDFAALYTPASLKADMGTKQLDPAHFIKVYKDYVTGTIRPEEGFYNIDLFLFMHKEVRNNEEVRYKKLKGEDNKSEFGKMPLPDLADEPRNIKDAAYMRAAQRRKEEKQRKTKEKKRQEEAARQEKLKQAEKSGSISDMFALYSNPNINIQSANKNKPDKKKKGR